MARQLQVAIPDVSVRDFIPGQGIMTMSAGDFEEVYQRDEYSASYDGVVTCFFLDCAHNIIAFIEIIHRILKVADAVRLQPREPSRLSRIYT